MVGIVLIVIKDKGFLASKENSNGKGKDRWTIYGYVKSLLVVVFLLFFFEPFPKFLLSIFPSTTCKFTSYYRLCL
jgi:hypothetical protein